MDFIPSVVLVGKPNVGKSTLFNRLCGRKRAIVFNRPGVTRDCRTERVTWMGLTFLLSDTPGLFDADTPNALHQSMRMNSLQTIASAHVILWLMDGKTGCSHEEAGLAIQLRKYHKPMTVLINKSESISDTHTQTQDQVWRLGIANAAFISAEHGIGLDALYDAIQSHINLHDMHDRAVGLEPTSITTHKNPKAKSVDDNTTHVSPPALKVLILGRPNVGKSTLTNLMIGQERQLVSDFPGVTRDSLAFDTAWMDRQLEVVDTAGIRRTSRITDQLEKITVWDARHRLRFTESVVMVIDASTASILEQQDARLMQSVIQEGRALVVALNKWDCVQQKEAYIKEIHYQISHNFGDLNDIPCLPLCAKTGEGLGQLMQTILEIEQSWNKRITTHQLNQWLKDTITHHQPPIVAGRAVRLKYITQRKARPPTFSLFVNRCKHLPQHYVRYLVNRLRSDFHFKGTPIRMEIRRTPNPYTTQKAQS